MRTIKFRIWNPSGKNMLYDIDNVFECLKQQIMFDRTMPDRGFGFPYDHRSEGMVWEQFTGLKDRNGKEVYEGDVVRIVFNQNANSYNGSNVNLTEHICIVEYNAAMAGFCLRNTTDKTPNKHNFKVISFNHYRLRDVKEIIGNVHENPELLTTKK